MKDVIYLIVKRGGVFNMKKRLPESLSAGEFCIKVVVNVPDKVFIHTIPTVSVDVPEPEILPASDIDIEMEWT